MKTFISVARVFDNEDDIFMFSRNVRKFSASEIFKKKLCLEFFFNWDIASS